MTTTENRLAVEFSKIMRESLTAEHLAQVNALNRTDDYAGCCASHDFFDANDAMATAWFHLHSHELDAGDEEQAGRCNEAWEIARAADYELELAATRAIEVIAHSGGRYVVRVSHDIQRSVQTGANKRGMTAAQFVEACIAIGLEV